MNYRPECDWRNGPRGWRKHERLGSGRPGRVRFFRRLAAVAFVLLLFAAWGFVFLCWLLVRAIFQLPAIGAGLWIPFATLLVSFVAAVALLRALRSLGTPVRDVMDAAERVADGDYAVRVAESGPPPVRALVRSFNTMTERLQAHEELRRNLMADVAHELRTPLTIIQGKLEGLLDGVYPREDAELAEILEEAKLLSRLIEDLRTLALSETGALKLEMEPAAITELVQDVIRSFTAQAASQQVTLKITMQTSLPEAMVDAVRVRQVMNNLLSNALAHTPPGGSIETSVTMENGAIAVQVRDTGTGMTRDEVEHAFDRFHKGPGSRGLGLGLNIARNLVIAHGGEMRAASQSGSGTTISFTLPLNGQAERQNAVGTI